MSHMPGLKAACGCNKRPHNLLIFCRDTFGDSRVPSLFWEHPELGQWCSMVRKNAKAPYRMSRALKQALDGLGFPWRLSIVRSLLREHNSQLRSCLLLHDQHACYVVLVQAKFHEHISGDPISSDLPPGAVTLIARARASELYPPWLLLYAPRQPPFHKKSLACPHGCTAQCNRRRLTGTSACMSCEDIERSFNTLMCLSSGGTPPTTSQTTLPSGSMHSLRCSVSVACRWPRHVPCHD